MKTEKLISFLNTGLSVEELPTINNLKEIEALLEKIDFSPSVKKEIKKGIDELERETIGHSAAFFSMIKTAMKEKTKGKKGK